MTNETNENVAPISFSMMTSGQIERLRKIVSDRHTAFDEAEYLAVMAKSGFAIEDFLLISEFQLEIATSIDLLHLALSNDCPMKPPASFLPSVCGLLGASAATFTKDRPFPHAGYLLASVEAVAKPFAQKFFEGAAYDQAEQATAEPVPVDEDGCHTLPNGDCIGPTCTVHSVTGEQESGQ